MFEAVSLEVGFGGGGEVSSFFLFLIDGRSCVEGGSFANFGGLADRDDARTRRLAGIAGCLILFDGGVEGIRGFGRVRSSRW